MSSPRGLDNVLVETFSNIHRLISSQICYFLFNQQHKYAGWELPKLAGRVKLLKRFNFHGTSRPGGGCKAKIFKLPGRSPLDNLSPTNPQLYKFYDQKNYKPRNANKHYWLSWGCGPYYVQTIYMSKFYYWGCWELSWGRWTSELGGFNPLNHPVNSNPAICRYKYELIQTWSYMAYWIQQCYNIQYR